MTSKTTRFDTYIKSCIAAKGTAFTHTRIPDKKLKISGGAYTVPNDADSKKTFSNSYYQKVFEKGRQEYMTEKQLIENGPLLIDIDFRYNTNITERQHTHEHIIDFVMAYADEVSKIATIEPNTKVNIFVLEKKNVNILDTKTKDGVHIIFGLKIHKGLQVMAREGMLKEIKQMWEDLPVENSWEEVLDEGVAKGFVNWQLYGSRKPGHEAYLIKKHYVIEAIEDGEWEGPVDMCPDGIEHFDTKKYFPQLCARYDDHPEAKLKQQFTDKFQSACNSLGRAGRKKTDNAKKPKIRRNLKYVRFDLIDSEEVLDELLEDMFDSLSACDYKLKEAHQFTMALPNKYYGPGSYNNWIRVGWALANTDPKMFLTWLKFSCQDNCRHSLIGSNGKFDWKLVPDLFEKWRGFDFENPDGLSNRSIMYWAKIDAKKVYEEIRVETIDYFIDQTIDDATEFDLANVLYNIFKDRFVCVSIKNNVWYEYRHGRWFEIDSGNAVRMCISREMHQEYLTRIHDCTAKVHTMEQTEEPYEHLRKRTSRMAEIAVLLKKTQWKNNIMREARELFYNQEFLDKLDQNPYLLCFNNYVVDFKNKTHRRGQPDDYISKCTNIEYIKLNKNKHRDTINDIELFMKQLFPDDKLRRYMWDHLASVLIGTTENQTFNIYTGSGRNGKSMMVELMSRGLGDYKGTVPITLITQKRNSIGSTSSEIVQLKGTRYAVMQEPSKGDRINEGIMKEITGGDPIQGRALFKDTVTFIPQFKLVVCTNTLFDIKSNDDGTWRRIRVCDFKSKFLENPYKDDLNFPKEEFPYQYTLNKKLSENFNKWAPILMSMLVEKAYKTMGNVTDCDAVLASSKEYREGQDYLAEFVKEKIKRKNGGVVKKTELIQTFKEWYTSNYGRGIPKGREVNDFMNKRFGRYRSGWHNIVVIYDNDDSNEIDDL
jgi:P4 family phage/plasmid primase-like protien